MTEPTPAETLADHRTPPPPLTTSTPVWAAWWDDFDEWDGAALYGDLHAALAHSAHAYVGEEYRWQPGDDADDEAPDVRLIWEQRHPHTAWRLLDGDRDTGVRVLHRRLCVPAAPLHGPQDATTADGAGAETPDARSRPQGGAQTCDAELREMRTTARVGLGLHAAAHAEAEKHRARAERAEAQLRAVRDLADDMRNWASPQGYAATCADRLTAVLNTPTP